MKEKHKPESSLTRLKRFQKRQEKQQNEGIILKGFRG
jgi:hypothetical protein